LKRQTVIPDEIIVVQASKADWIPELTDRDLIVVQQRGKGVSNALNEGVARASSEVVAFIDDDAWAAPEWIEALRGRYAAEPSVAGVGGLVKDSETGEVWFDRGAIDAFGFAYMRAENSRPHLETFPYLAGCNMSFRKEILRQFGGFDEFYTYSHEEPDLCVRIQRAGYRIVFQQTAVVWHHYAPGPTRARAAYNTERSRVYFALSNFDLPLRQYVAGALSRSARQALGLVLGVSGRTRPATSAASDFLQAVIGGIVGFPYGIHARMHRSTKCLRRMGGRIFTSCIKRSSDL
jgi:GT2 family glycosyltransferase